MIAKSRDMKPPQDDAPDRPLTDDEFARGRTAFVAKAARSATGLSQSDFAKRYRIPPGTIRDWEQGRREADTAALNYLLVIKKMPEAVADAMNGAA